MEIDIQGPSTGYGCYSDRWPNERGDEPEVRTAGVELHSPSRTVRDEMEKTNLDGLFDGLFNVIDDDSECFLALTTQLG